MGSRRRYVNGAGLGGRLVTRRVASGANPSGVALVSGRSQFGTREQRRYDIRSAFGMRG